MKGLETPDTVEQSPRRSSVAKRIAGTSGLGIVESPIMLLQPQGLVNGTGTAVAIQNHHSSFHLEPLLEQQPHTHSNPVILSEQSHQITL
jgi:hypothetical protein